MTGGAIHKSNFRRRSFVKLVQAAGVPYIRPYDMRHTVATLLLLADVHPKIVSEMLGHTWVTITLTIYRHVLPVRDPTAKAEGLPPVRQRTWTIGRLTAASLGRLYRDRQGVCCGHCGQRCGPH